MRIGRPSAVQELRAVAMSAPANRHKAVRPGTFFFFFSLSSSLKTSLLSFLLCSCAVAVAATEIKVATASKPQATAAQVVEVTAATVIAASDPGAAGGTGGRAQCPINCFCDWNASLLSCSGPEDDDDEDEEMSREEIDQGDDDDMPKQTSVNGSAVGNKNNKTNNNGGSDHVWPTAASASVQRLDLRHLMVPRLDAARLNGTDELLELSIVLCGLELVANGTFIRHGRLERLDLSQNRLVTLMRVNINS